MYFILVLSWGIEGEDADKILSRQVCENVKRCLDEWKNKIIDLEFEGKPSGLTRFCLQAKKASLLITRASSPRPLPTTPGGTSRFSLRPGIVSPPCLRAGGKTEYNKLLAVFFHSKHYQALMPLPDE